LGYIPIILSELYNALEKYPIKDIAKLLKYGFTSCFNMNYPVPVSSRKSVTQCPVG
jgi:hypothetical protein